MIILCRNFLVLFLVLLQCFAPLVHAHVDEHYANVHVGLHVPGLESHDQKLDGPALRAVYCAFSSNNLVVSVNTGIKVKQDNKLPTSSDGDYYIHQPFIVFNAAITATDINFSPQALAFVQPFANQPYAPRAPPSL